MPYKKGQSGNPKGRPQNSKNKGTAELRQRIAELINDNFDRIESDFQQLDPEKRLGLLEKYLKYCLPPLQSMSVQAEIKSELETLSDDKLQELAQRIIETNFQSHEPE